MNPSEINYIAQLNNATIYINKYIAPVLYIVGNIGNFSSIYMFSKKIWRKNVCVFYFLIYIIFNLCYINSTMIASIFIVGYNITTQNTNVVLCKIYIYVAFLFATSSPSVLMLASIDRLLISSQNVDTRLYSSKRLAYLMISISTCFWIIFNSHLLVKVNIYELAPSYYYCSYEPSNLYLNFIDYFLLTIHSLFFIIMFILSIFSFKNVHHIQFIPREQQRRELRTMTKRDFQLLRCLFVQGIIFMIFAFLINIYFVYGAITRDQIQTPLEEAIDDFINNLFNFLYNIPYCANFFIFVSVSKAFRHDFKRLIYKIFGKIIMPMREENNQVNVAVIN